MKSKVQIAREIDTIKIANKKANEALEEIEIPKTSAKNFFDEPVIKNYLTPEQRDFWEKVLKHGSCCFTSCDCCPYYLDDIVKYGVAEPSCSLGGVQLKAKAKEILETNPKFDNEPELPEWSKTMQKVIKVEGSVAIVASGRYEELLKIEKDYELIKKVED